MTGNEIYASSGMRRNVVQAAVKGAARSGEIMNVGAEKSPRWVVPNARGTTEQGGTT